MSLEIVLGPVCSGKSTYALSYIRRQQAIQKNLLILKPGIGIPHAVASVLETYDKEKVPCVLWDVNIPLRPTAKMVEGYDCIVIEDAHLFKELRFFVFGVLRVARKHILAVGLDGDQYQLPYTELLSCIPFATKVTKLRGLCRACENGTEAEFTTEQVPFLQKQRHQIGVGNTNLFRCVCMKHFLETEELAKKL
jgi:thymidine kinase